MLRHPALGATPARWMKLEWVQGMGVLGALCWGFPSNMGGDIAVQAGLSLCAPHHGSLARVPVAGVDTVRRGHCVELGAQGFLRQQAG